MNDVRSGPKWLPPVCLVFGLALAICGFAVQSLGELEPDMKLHRARLDGQEQHEKLLEADLERRRWARTVLIAGLYGGSIAFAAAAYWTMGSATGARK